MTTTRTRRRIIGDDPALAVRLRAGDPAAFDELFRRHHQRLTRYVAARLAGRDRDTVDDLVQDAFCDAIALAAELGLQEEATALSQRLENIKAVFRSQFS